MGWSRPSFRCPPRVVGVQRTLRRHAGGAVVAVQVRGRPWAAVLADMIEGVVVVNRLAPPAADRSRTELWEAIGRPVAAADREPRRLRPARVSRVRASSTISVCPAGTRSARPSSSGSARSPRPRTPAR